MKVTANQGDDFIYSEKAGGSDAVDAVDAVADKQVKKTIKSST